jgi:hypothetical protein
MHSNVERELRAEIEREVTYHIAITIRPTKIWQGWKPQVSANIKHADSIRQLIKAHAAKPLIIYM